MAPLAMPLGDLQPLPPPDPLYPLDVDRPALRPEQRRDPAIAVTAVLAGEPDDGRCQSFFIVSRCGPLALGRAVLADNLAGAALGDPEPILQMRDTAPATSGAQKFPSAASFKISLSNVNSATARFRRWFSLSSSFSRLT